MRSARRRFVEAGSCSIVSSASRSRSRKECLKLSEDFPYSQSNNGEATRASMEDYVSHRVFTTKGKPSGKFRESPTPSKSCKCYIALAFTGRNQCERSSLPGRRRRAEAMEVRSRRAGCEVAGHNRSSGITGAPELPVRRGQGCRAETV